MKYLLALLVPPFAVLGCRKPFQFGLNLMFWLLALILLVGGLATVFLAPVLVPAAFILWLMCAFHAMTCCVTTERNRQMNRLVAAIETRQTTQH
jgi:hypothetical protein